MNKNTSKAKKTEEQGPLFEEPPNKRPHSGRRSGDWELVARAEAKRQDDVPGAKGTRLTRKTRAGLFAAIHEEAVAEVERKRAAETTAKVRELRRLNELHGEPPFEEPPEPWTLTPEQQAVADEHWRAHQKRQADKDAAYDAGPPERWPTPRGLKGRRVTTGGRKPRDLPWREHITRRRRKPSKTTAAAIEKTVSVLRARRAWKTRNRPEGITDRQWEAVRLVEVEGLSMAEAGRKLGGISKVAVFKLLHKVKKGVNESGASRPTG